MVTFVRKKMNTNWSHGHCIIFGEETGTFAPFHKLLLTCLSGIISDTQNGRTLHMTNEVIIQEIQWLIAHRNLWEMCDKSASESKRQKSS